jgi:hypothetical protein
MSRRRGDPCIACGRLIEGPPSIGALTFCDAECAAKWAQDNDLDIDLPQVQAAPADTDKTFSLTVTVKINLTSSDRDQLEDIAEYVNTTGEVPLRVLAEQLGVPRTWLTHRRRRRRRK